MTDSLSTISEPSDDQLPLVVEMAFAMRAERGEPAPALTAGALQDRLHGDDAPRLFCAVINPGATGYVLFQDTFDPASFLPGTHLCDIYVRPEARRHGLGQRLLQHVIDHGRARRRNFVWWATALDNGPMLALTEAMGGRHGEIRSCAIVL